MIKRLSSADHLFSRRVPPLRVPQTHFSSFTHEITESGFVHPPCHGLTDAESSTKPLLCQVCQYSTKCNESLSHYKNGCTNTGKCDHSLNYAGKKSIVSYIRFLNTDSVALKRERLIASLPLEKNRRKAEALIKSFKPRRQTKKAVMLSLIARPR